MARLLWLADVLRAAGLTVHEVPGWRTREVPGTDYGPVRGVIIHETRGSANSTDAGEIGVLVNGRPGLSGPIAQLYLSRSGEWHVVASGTCHHVKTGWGGPFNGLGNDSLLGIEAQHAESEDWANKPVQYASYVRGVAAILRHTGWPAPVGHKEHQPGDKPDPEFSMPAFRGAVAAGAAAPTSTSNEGDGTVAFYITPNRDVYNENGVHIMASEFPENVANRIPLIPAASVERVQQLTGARDVLDPVALKDALIGALDAALPAVATADIEAALVSALQAPAVHAALVAAANEAEDS